MLRSGQEFVYMIKPSVPRYLCLEMPDWATGDMSPGDIPCGLLQCDLCGVAFEENAEIHLAQNNEARLLTWDSY